MSIDQKLVAIQGDAPVNAGAIVYFSCVDVAQEPLRAAWSVEGLDVDLLPAIRRPLICLRDAMAGCVRSVGIRGGKFFGAEVGATEFSVDVRDLARQSGVVAVCDVATEADSDKQRTISRAAFGKVGALFDHSADQLVVSGEIQPDIIREAYRTARSLIHHSSLANMLANRVMDRLDGVSLRETGGVYYIPPHSIALWDRVSRALTAVGCKLYQIPAMQGEHACAAILDAVQREAGLLADTLTDTLVESELGPRALQGKVAVCDKALQKLERYETLLGANLEAIRARIGSLSVGYGEAAITALAGLDGLLGD